MKIRKVLIRSAFLTIAVALLLPLIVYLPVKKHYAEKLASLDTEIAELEQAIRENDRCANLQEEISNATEVLQESRLSLYQHFPKELREEDQLLYLSTLERAFHDPSTGELGFTPELNQHFRETLGSTIHFDFGTAFPLVQLSDGSVFMGENLQVYFTGSYENMKQMIAYLAADERIVSIQDASMIWNGSEVSGSFTLLYYLMQSDLLEYEAPFVAVPQIDRDNIFVQGALE